MRQIASSWVGLFWIDGVGELVSHSGDVEFNESDVQLGNTVLPKGVHRDYGTYDRPRGRVELENGKIVISIGVDCSDKTVEQVIRDYGLSRYRCIIEVKRSSFWDKRI